MIAALLGVLTATIVEFHKVKPEAAYLLLPYLAWTSYAAALTVSWSTVLLSQDLEGHCLPAAVQTGTWSLVTQWSCITFSTAACADDLILVDLH